MSSNINHSETRTKLVRLLASSRGIEVNITFPHKADYEHNQTDVVEFLLSAIFVKGSQRSRQALNKGLYS